MTYPTSLKAFGIVNAPVPTMRLNMYTNPVVGEYFGWPLTSGTKEDDVETLDILLKIFITVVDPEPRLWLVKYLFFELCTNFI